MTTTTRLRLMAFSWFVYFALTLKAAHCFFEVKMLLFMAESHDLRFPQIPTSIPGALYLTPGQPVWIKRSEKHIMQRIIYAAYLYACILNGTYIFFKGNLKQLQRKHISEFCVFPHMRGYIMGKITASFAEEPMLLPILLGGNGHTSPALPRM